VLAVKSENRECADLLIARYRGLVSVHNCWEQAPPYVQCVKFYLHLSVCLLILSEIPCTMDKSLDSACTWQIAIARLVPRPSTSPVFDCLQYAKTEGEGLGNFITIRGTADVTDSRCNSLFTFVFTVTEKLENQNKFQRRGKSYL